MFLCAGTPPLGQEGRARSTHRSACRVIKQKLKRPLSLLLNIINIRVVMKFRNEKYCNEKFLFCFLWCSYCLNSKHCVDEASRFGFQLSNNVNTFTEIVDEHGVRGKSKNNYTPQQTKTICKIKHRFIAIKKAIYFVNNLCIFTRLGCLT